MCHCILLYSQCPILGREEVHLQGVVGTLGSRIEELKGRGWGHQWGTGWGHQSGTGWGHQGGRRRGHQGGREWGHLGIEVLTPLVGCHLRSHRAGQRWEGHAAQWGPLTWWSPASSKLEGLPLCLLTSCTTVAGRVFLLVSL